MKICKYCHIEKEVNRLRICEECRYLRLISKRKRLYNIDPEKFKQNSKNYRDNNKEKLKETRNLIDKKTKTQITRKKYLLNTLYNISSDEYDRMFENQNGACNICKRHQSNFKKALSADHDHNTGRVRGLLCDLCNRGIGFLKDNILFLENAIRHIKNV
jgi:nitrate/TMAO reductase-like tetraheme cytochrome c subunit